MAQTNRNFSDSDPPSPCVWCGAEMVGNASICQTCDRSQSTFYECGKQLLTFFGVIGAIASAVAFVWPFAKDLQAKFTDPQIEVDFLRTESDETLVRNIGQRSVIISHFEARLDPSFENKLLLAKVINVVLESGEVARPDLRSNNTLRIQSSETLDFFRWMTTSSVGHRDAFLAALLSSDEENRKVLRIEVFGEDRPTLKDARAVDLKTMRSPSELMLLPFECKMFFAATNEDKLRSLDVPCTGLPSTSLSELDFIKLMEKY